MREEAGRGSLPAVRSEARGPHWIAWIPDPDGKPLDSVVLVGQTREEAETRARAWAAARTAARPS